MKDIPNPDQIIEEIIFTQEQVSTAINSLAEEISLSYPSAEKVLVLTVLKGGKFLADALKDTNKFNTSNYSFADITASSYYHSPKSSGHVKVDFSHVQQDLTNFNVLVIDDIFDTGNTLTRIKQLLLQRNPSSVKTCVLLDRNGPSDKIMSVDFIGLKTDNQAFLLGCGLDFKGHYRELPYLASIKAKYCK